MSPDPVDGDITLRRLAATDLPLLGRWLADPEVRRWWNHDPSPAAVERDFGPGMRGEEPGEDWVVLLDGEPVGLVQRAFVHDYPEEVEVFSRAFDVPLGAVEIDYLLGEAALRGRGLGTRVIRHVVERTWRELPTASDVVVAVVAANVASWRAVERAGLPRVAEVEIEPDNPVDDPLHHVYRLPRP
ncbi:GNAT family N-acetyltransferase [Aquipuribacter sp. SD81]|uniref:GNAT family N-acetyltransferase n=1 Tax=Aquipuribacter sp. SD81 TaxID=3127703 RepID=UPI003015F401